MALGQYKHKRDFHRSPEPKALKAKGKGNLFVIQKHAARNLHYDFRLEMDGVLKSWAVPKGLPTRKGEKRLAIQVEDHPFAYARFEGIIPKGNYGGGTVMVWDIGEYGVTGATPRSALAAGRLHLHLNGKKLRGDWTFVRMKKAQEEHKQPWLIFKSGEDHKAISSGQEDRSALSQRSMSRIASAADAQWRSGKTILKSPNVELPDSVAKLSKSKPSFAEPMKARLVTQLSPGGDWFYEIKFDGVRTIAIKQGDKVQLLSRTHKSYVISFPEIRDAVRLLPCDTVVLDGEIVALDEQGRSSFQMLQPFIHGNGSSVARPPIIFYVFDILNLEGRNTGVLPLHERKKLLETVLQKPPPWIRVSSAFQDRPSRLLKQVQKLGLEGLIGKKRLSEYEPGRRSGSWIKLKIVTEQEFVIGGYTAPKGSRKYFGSLVIGYYQRKQLLYASKVGTGFDSSLLRSLFKQFQKFKTVRCPFTNLPSKRSDTNGVSASEMKRCTWLKPTLVCQVRFSQWTNDHHLRQPVFLGLREDKRPNEVVREGA